MSSQRPWVKLWVSWLMDPQIQALSSADKGRWVELLLLVAEHGTEGTWTFESAHTLSRSWLNRRSLRNVCDDLKRLPGVVVTCSEFPVVSITVTFKNWARYQIGSSTPRTREWRSKRVPGTLREQSRERHGNADSDPQAVTREEKRRQEPPNPRDPDDNPAHIRFNIPD